MPRTNVIPTTPINPNGVNAPTTKSALGKDDFLKLLVGQMKNQDPFNPLKGTEFAAQLAQFSGLEQLQNMNDNLQESMSTNYVLTSSINNALAANFVGKDVRASSNEFYWEGGSGVRMGYTLPQSATSVKVKVYNESGDLIREIRGGVRQGDNIALWDGKDESGGIVDEGVYNFTVTATSGDTVVRSSPFVYGRISGVRYDQEGTVFLLNGVSVRLADILEVFNGQ